MNAVGIEFRTSRPYHPQSQGKCERSHGVWKRKIEFDLLQNQSESKLNYRF